MDSFAFQLGQAVIFFPVLMVIIFGIFRVIYMIIEAATRERRNAKKSVARIVRESYPNSKSAVVLSCLDRLDDQATQYARLRARVEELGDFEAYQECPKCGIINCHLIMPKSKLNKVKRKCVNCGFVWKQR